MHATRREDGIIIIIMPLWLNHMEIFSHRAAAAKLIYCQESLSAILLPQHMPVCMSALVGSPQFLKRTLTTTLAEMV